MIYKQISTLGLLIMRRREKTPERVITQKFHEKARERETVANFTQKVKMRNSMYMYTQTHERTCTCSSHARTNGNISKSRTTHNGPTLPPPPGRSQSQRSMLVGCSLVSFHEVYTQFTLVHYLTAGNSISSLQFPDNSYCDNGFWILSPFIICC